MRQFTCPRASIKINFAISHPCIRGITEGGGGGGGGLPLAYSWINHLLQASCKHIMLTPHWAATTIMSEILWWREAS